LFFFVIVKNDEGSSFHVGEDEDSSF